MRSLTSSLCVLVAILTCAARAAACPVCDTPTAADVRAALAGDDWALNLAAAALPSAVFFGVVAAVHFGPSARRHPRRDRAAAHRDPREDQP
jgi:hypothetical protein